jgi:hypothetical protein
MRLGDARFYADFILSKCKTPAHRNYRQNLLAWLEQKDAVLAAEVKTIVSSEWRK